MAKKLADNKILIVLCCRNKAEAEQQTQLLQSINFVIPAGTQLLIHSIIRNKNLARELNNVQKQFDAKYKIYITAPVIRISTNFFKNFFDSFYYSPGAAMTGLFGSEMPIDGDFVQAKSIYGSYNFSDDGGQTVKTYFGKSPVFDKEVHILEPSVLATNEDIPWDERMGEDFLFVTQCCKYRNAGHRILVAHQQEGPWIVFARDTFDYRVRADQKNYQKQLETFRLFYNKKMMPLVSVLIPTYNQPKYCMEALESALNQTYPNIEILVGDDSTNEDTKKAIQPYLKKYRNIQYFYHDDTNPRESERGGLGNMFFLLNKCSGEYVSYLLHDDLFYPTKTAKMMNYFVRDLEEKISLVTSARDAIDADGKNLGRQGTWQPREDEIISGEEVGRTLLFTIGNFIGELTTAMVRKRDLLVKTLDGKKVFSVGTFCGICSKIYGDLDTWYDMLRRGDMVFIAESLSAFRHHADQSTHKPSTHVNLPRDAINFTTIAWLNNAFLHSEEEFLYSCRKWTIYMLIFIKGIFDDDPEDFKKLKQDMYNLRDVILSGGYEKVFDAAVNFLLKYLTDDKNVLELVRKNEKTGLWEKSRDGLYYRTLPK